jgi:uncharacterized membrane protein
VEGLFMSFLQRSAGQIAWIVLSLLGIGVAIYLTVVHYQGAPLVCSESGLIDCSSVLTSVYSKVPGTALPITVPGLLWFSIAGGLALATWRGWAQERFLRIAEFAWSLLGMLTVFYLVYIEIVVLHKICAWCTVIHALILLMFLIAVVQLYMRPSEEDFEEEEEEAPVVSGKRR